MLYFFNILEDGVEILDPDGTELPNCEAAQAEAFTIIRELRSALPHRFRRGSVLEVVSASGERVIALPVRTSA